ncbi:MAG TPA: tetratricopeptide repeat protein, partial [Chthonomonadales bacterium]|nr:tetratricopeptide repeat protein [Chthonomonadales bacterium]
KILKHDSKDLTVLNTVGDLYSREGDVDKAVECFKSVGDAYASQGFTVKAIAMYKKLSKIKASMECALRLAELYTQQGLFNDARAQYLQVAEEFLKTGQLDQAVKIFEKTLEMDPDNVAMRTKLAEVYIRLDKKPEAWKILSAAAESLHSKGQLAAADEILQRMLKLEPGNSYALMLRGKAALDAGDTKAAIGSLSKIADLDSNPEALRALFQAYLKARNFQEAGTVAGKLANVHDDGAAITEYADALVQAQMYREALHAYEQHADRFLRSDPAKLIEALRPMISHVKDDPEALETILALHQKAGETAHITEIYELLTHAYAQSEDFEKARDYYLKLTQLEPANQMHARNYQQVLAKSGGSAETTHLITPEEGAVLVDELEATAPFIEQRYDDEVALAVRAAMTDAELFISYNMPAKALGPLESAQPKAPQDLRLNQKLAALYTRAGKFAEAGMCCRKLQILYRDAGHAEEATRYGDLATKYEERSGSKPQVAAAAAPVATKAAVAAAGASAPVQAAAAADFEISAPVAAEQNETAVATAPAAQMPPLPTPIPKPAAPAPKSGKSGLFFH